MKPERSNIKHHLWRKKVDSSLFENKCTVLPNWYCKLWEISSNFKSISSKSDYQSNVSIKLKKKIYRGWITQSKDSNRKNPLIRLWFNDSLAEKLKNIFLMSYMRNIENNIRKKTEENVNIEDEIPFWEFLDIEFNTNDKQFIFTPHYTQKALFPHLFNSIVSSPKLKEIEHNLINKNQPKIFKQHWKPIDEYHTEIGANNVIYMLINKSKKEFYIGEANNLIERFSNGSYQKHWEFYRYDKLPSILEAFRLDLERSLISSFSTIISNDKNINSMNLSNYKLVNKKIDK